MMNVTNTVPATVPTEAQKKKWHVQRHLVSDTGYAAIGCGTITGITGFRKVKFPHKMKVHKYSAHLAGAFSVLHFAFIKGLGRIFDKKS